MLTFLPWVSLAKGSKQSLTLNPQGPLQKVRTREGTLLIPNEALNHKTPIVYSPLEP